MSRTFEATIASPGAPPFGIRVEEYDVPTGQDPHVVAERLVKDGEKLLQIDWVDE